MRTGRVAVTGSTGQLGTALCRQLGSAAIPLTRDILPLEHAEQSAQLLRELRPDVVVNCAAYTAVDRAESNASTCLRVNADAVGILAETCRDIGARFVQISTDYVFGGEPLGRPWREDDPTNPQGVYARSKLASEQQAQSCPGWLVVRTCGLFGRALHGRNFVETMLRIGRQQRPVRVVDDQYCTPSSAAEVARAIDFLITERAEGIVHVVNQGSTNWYDFAAEIFRLTNMSVRLDRISTVEFGAAAPRPTYSVLDTSRYARYGGPALSHWQQALRDYLPC